MGTRRLWRSHMELVWEHVLEACSPESWGSGLAITSNISFLSNLIFSCLFQVSKQSLTVITFMSDWLFSGRKKKYEKHFCSLGALSRAEGSIFISPPLLLSRNWKAGAVICIYTLWPPFSPLLPRMSSLRTGADCLCFGPGKVAEAKCVQRRG